MNKLLTFHLLLSDDTNTLFKEYKKLGGGDAALIIKIYDYMKEEMIDDKPHFLQQSKEPMSLRQMFNQHISHIVAAEIQKLKDRKEPKQ